jgi:hypothetical protein
MATFPWQPQNFDLTKVTPGNSFPSGGIDVGQIDPWGRNPPDWSFNKVNQLGGQQLPDWGGQNTPDGLQLLGGGGDSLFDPIRTGQDIWDQWPGGKQPGWENLPMIGPAQQRFRTEYLDLLRQYSGKQQQYGEVMWPRFRGMVDDPMATLGQYLPQMESQFRSNLSGTLQQMRGAQGANLAQRGFGVGSRGGGPQLQANLQRRMGQAGAWGDFATQQTQNLQQIREQGLTGLREIAGDTPGVTETIKSVTPQITSAISGQSSLAQATTIDNMKRQIQQMQQNQTGGDGGKGLMGPLMAGGGLLLGAATGGLATAAPLGVSPLVGAGVGAAIGGGLGGIAGQASGGK